MDAELAVDMQYKKHKHLQKIIKVNRLLASLQLAMRRYLE